MLGTPNGPRMDEDPVGPRQRVAGGLVGYKHGMRGKGDGTEKGVWLGPRNSPRRMGRRGTWGIRRDGCGDIAQGKGAGAGRERPVLGAQNGPSMHEDPEGPRRRVAGGPAGYKHEMVGKGDGTEKGVAQGSHNSPKRMGRHRTQGVGREGGWDVAQGRGT